MNKEIPDISQEQVQEAFDQNQEKAEKLLKNKDQLEDFLQDIERKLKDVPIVGTQLSYIPTFISLVKSYIKQEYTDIPVDSIVAIVTALIYFLSPVDFIPDFIPVIGYIDDTAVIGFCLANVQKDLDRYIDWRAQNKN